MPSVGLDAIPEEILLHTLQFNCGIEAWVSLALTSRRLSLWLNERIFWISALRTTKLLRPVACPFHHDLTTCTLNELKDIGLRTIRVERNWSVPEPRLTATRTVKVEEMSEHMHDIIFHIPATHLYLLHDRNTRQLAVWDMGKGSRVTEPLDGIPFIEDVSAAQSEPGAYSIGLLILTDVAGNREMAVAVVHYGEEVTLSTPFVTSLPFKNAPHPGYFDIFFTKEVVGVMTGTLDLDQPPTAPFQDLLCVSAFNIVSRSQTLIITDLDLAKLHASAEDGDTATTVSGDDLFFLYDAGSESTTCRIPMALLPTDATRTYPEKVRFRCADDPQLCHIRINPASTDSDWRSTAQGVLSTGPYYDVAALSIRRYTRRTPIGEGPEVQSDSDTEGETKLGVRFWTTGWATGGGEVGNDWDAHWEISGERGWHRTLIPYSSPFIPGTIYDRPDTAWKFILMTPSGRVMAAVVKPPYGSNARTLPQLSMVRFNPEEERCTVHTLELPEELSLKKVGGFTIDDHCGIVTLQCDGGTWISISYA